MLALSDHPCFTRAALSRRVHTPRGGLTQTCGRRGALGRGPCQTEGQSGGMAGRLEPRAGRVRPGGQRTGCQVPCAGQGAAWREGRGPEPGGGREGGEPRGCCDAQSETRSLRRTGGRAPSTRTSSSPCSGWQKTKTCFPPLPSPWQGAAPGSLLRQACLDGRRLFGVRSTAYHLEGA